MHHLYGLAGIEMAIGDPHIRCANRHFDKTVFHPQSLPCIRAIRSKVYHRWKKVNISCMRIKAPQV